VSLLVTPLLSAGDQAIDGSRTHSSGSGGGNKITLTNLEIFQELPVAKNSFTLSSSGGRAWFSLGDHLTALFFSVAYTPCSENAVRFVLNIYTDNTSAIVFLQFSVTHY